MCDSTVLQFVDIKATVANEEKEDGNLGSGAFIVT